MESEPASVSVTPTAYYWINIEDISCVEKLVARLERALKDPSSEYTPAIIILAALESAINRHYRFKGVVEPIQTKAKLRYFQKRLQAEKLKSMVLAGWNP
jgi:hypothetical protein